MDSSLGHLQLAIELITMIFEEIDDIYDAIMLALTHDTLMVIGWEHIRALLVQDSAPWAGTRIIMAGGHGCDVPGGLILEEEKSELGRLYLENVGQVLETLKLFKICSSGFGNSPNATRADHPRLMGLSYEEWRLVRTITEKGEYQYQWEKGWVLMNQTKKEYVISMAASSILPSMQATDARCFGQLILSRICWSTVNSISMKFSGDLHRGVWAGDRFVIVTVDEFEAMPSAKGWKDVSVEAAEWLKEIFLAEGVEY